MAGTAEVVAAVCSWRAEGATGVLRSGRATIGTGDVGTHGQTPLPAPLNARAGAGFKVGLVKGNLTAGRAMPSVRRLIAILVGPWPSTIGLAHCLSRRF